VLEHFAGRSKSHIHFPEEEGVAGRAVDAMLAEEDFLPTDGGICTWVGIDLVTHEVLGAPATLTPALHASGLL